jgi:hypothetical protein
MGAVNKSKTNSLAAHDHIAALTRFVQHVHSDIRTPGAEPDWLRLAQESGESAGNHKLPFNGGGCGAVPLRPPEHTVSPGGHGCLKTCGSSTG